MVLNVMLWTSIDPLTVTVLNTPLQTAEYLDANLGIYAQDRWTMNRLTLSGGIRLDLQNESTEPFTAQPHRWLPNRNNSFTAIENVPNWKDIDPRVSVAYDLFGNGKTAVKASVSRGVEQDSIRYAQANNPASTIITQTNILNLPASGQQPQNNPGTPQTTAGTSGTTGTSHVGFLHHLFIKHFWITAGGVAATTATVVAVVVITHNNGATITAGPGSVHP